MLDIGQWFEANNLGNDLRVGNEPEARNHLAQVLCDPSAMEIIRDANFMATQHAPWDVHGPGGTGVATLRVNDNFTIDFLNKETGLATPMAILGTLNKCGQMLPLPEQKK